MNTDLYGSTLGSKWEAGFWKAKKDGFETASSFL
jgi:hypothetical protein